MKIFLLLLFATNILFAQAINQKFVLLSDKNETQLKTNYEQLLEHFKTDVKLQKLQTDNNLVLKEESLGDFNIITLSPVKSIDLKNKLFLNLMPNYPEIFALNIKATKKPKLKPKPKPKKVYKPKVKKEELTAMQKYKKDYSYVLSLEWLAFILISIIALVLIARSVIQLYNLKKLQTDFKQDQDELEKEIQKTGEVNA